MWFLFIDDSPNPLNCMKYNFLLENKSVVPVCSTCCVWYILSEKWVTVFLHAVYSLGGNRLRADYRAFCNSDSKSAQKMALQTFQRENNLRSQFIFPHWYDYDQNYLKLEIDGWFPLFVVKETKHSSVCHMFLFREGIPKCHHLLWNFVSNWNSWIFL